MFCGWEGGRQKWKPTTGFMTKSPTSWLPRNWDQLRAQQSHIEYRTNFSFTVASYILIIWKIYAMYPLTIMIMAAAAAATKTADDDDWYATVKYKKLHMWLSNSLVHNAVHSNFFKSLQLSCLFCAKSISRWTDDREAVIFITKIPYRMTRMCWVTCMVLVSSLL